MAITLVQKSTLAQTSTFGSSLQSNALSANPTVGSYLVAWCWGYLSNNTSTAPSFTDSAGNTWNVPANVYQQNTLSQVFFSAAYAKVTASGASFKVTAAPPGTFTAKGSILVAEFSGVVSASPLDGTPVGATSGTSANFSLGSMAVSSGSLIIAGCCNSDGSTNVTMATPSGFTLGAAQTDSARIIGIGQAIYGIGLTNPAPSWNDPNIGTWAGSQFALKAAGAALRQQMLAQMGCGA